MPSFGQLTVIILAGLCGPLMAASRTIIVPVIVGELLAGIALGKSGTGTIHAADPTIAFLGTIGFAVLMMAAGMHVPLRNRALLGSLRRGAVASAAAALFGIVGGELIAHALNVGHPGVWAILLATGSAAVVLPALEEAGVDGTPALLAMAWATVADVATIVAVPLVLNPSKAPRAGLGAVAVVLGAVVVLIAARRLSKLAFVHQLRQQSKKRTWALDLRMALLALFGLCALAQWVGTSIMIAGFAAGLVVAFEGGPKRLSKQVTGIAGGFFVPLFFVTLGASLDVRAFVRSPNELELAVALIAGMTIVHMLAGRVIGARVSTSLIVTAQLGVPAAVVKLGESEGVLRHGQGTAIIVAALASLGICAAGTMLARRTAEAEAPTEPPREPPPREPQGAVMT